MHKGTQLAARGRAGTFFPVHLTLNPLCLKLGTSNPEHQALYQLLNKDLNSETSRGVGLDSDVLTLMGL